MSEQINDGGPAFPMPEQQFTGGMDGYYGMSLRDYFAAKALQGFIANRNRPTRFDPKDDAAYCYQLADAMLKARQS